MDKLKRIVNMQYRLDYLGVAAALIYCLFLGFYLSPSPRWLREAFIWPAMLSLIFIYWQGYLQVRAADRNNPEAFLAIPAFGLLFALICLFVPPFHSTDLYTYMNYGWQQVHYGMNPYVHMVRDIPGWRQDPLLMNCWVNNPAPYGFFFVQLTKILSVLGMGSKAATFCWFKLANFGFWAACGWLIWKGSKSLNLPRPDVALYLYAWSPLILIHSLCNGHNDILMAFFLILTAYCILRKWWLGILPALFTGILVKYSLIGIAPFVLYWMGKEYGWRKTALSLLWGILAAVLIALPYLPEWSHFQWAQMRENAVIAHGSPESVIETLYTWISIPFDALSAWKPGVESLLRSLFLAGYALLTGWQMLRCMRYPHFTPALLFREILLNQLLLITVFSMKFYPWYLVIILPFCFYLPPQDPLRHLTLLFSVTLLPALTFIGQAHLLNYSLMILAPFIFYRLDAQEEDASLAPSPLQSLIPSP